MNNHKQRIWIISEFYFPSENTTAYLISKIAEGLSKVAEVNVITATSSSKHNLSREDIDGVSVFRVKGTHLNKNKFFQRTVLLILLGIRMFFKALKSIKRGDTVLVVTNPATIVFLIRIVRVFRKFELTFLVHDVFPENLVVAKVLKPQNVFYLLTLHLFNWAYVKADRLIVIGRDMEVKMKKKLGNSCPPIHYIPNFADVKKIIPSRKEENSILSNNGLLDKVVLLFTGNIGRAQDIKNLLKTMKLLKDNRNVHFLFIGDGANKGKIRDYIKENALDNITLLPPISRAFSNDFLNAGDIGVVSLQAGRKGIGVPSKTYTFLAAGKPILAIVDEDSEIHQMVNESNCGWWSPPGNPQVLRDLILKVVYDKIQIEKRSHIARKLAEDKYSIEKIVPQFQQILIS